MEGHINGCKKEGLARKQEDRSVKTQAVIMETEIFDCLSCSEPLSPPIFQCPCGRFICDFCRTDPREKKCRFCSGAFSKRSHSMERVVKSILVPCKHGCPNRITYYEKEEHEDECPYAPCFCPRSGCGFSGPKAVFLEHISTEHKWPRTNFKYYEQFDVPAKPGLHFLSAEDDHLFLLNVETLSFLVLTVSIVCVQPNVAEASFGCSLTFRWHSDRYQAASVDMIKNSSLSGGPPKDYFCVLPNVFSEGKAGVLESIMITKMVDNEDELEDEDDDDSSYEVGRG